MHNTMKLVSNVLASQFKNLIQTNRTVWDKEVIGNRDICGELEYVVYALKNNLITFKQQKKENGNGILIDEVKANDCRPSHVPKKKQKTTSIEEESHSRYGSSDSTSSRSSSRSRRAAAQAADQKLNEMQCLIKATKLRRPTDFDGKQSKQARVVSSPPSKCRRIRHNQSAGNSNTREDGDQKNELEPNENLLLQNQDFGDEFLNKKCQVVVARINTPTIKAHLKGRINNSRSLERSLHKNSDDLFNDDSLPLSHIHVKEYRETDVTGMIEQLDNTQAKRAETVELNSMHDVALNKTHGKKLKSKKTVDSGISSNGEEQYHMGKDNFPVAHSSPIPCESSLPEEFHGFDVHTLQNDASYTLLQRNIVIKSEVELDENVLECENSTVGKNEEGNNAVVVEIKEDATKSNTKAIPKRDQIEDMDAHQKEIEKQPNDQTFILHSKKDKSPNVFSRTYSFEKNNAEVHNLDKGDGVSNSNNNMTTREEQQSKSDSPAICMRSRTKTLRTHTDNDSSEERNMRSRTKTIKKAVQTNSIVLENKAKDLEADFEETVHHKNEQIISKSVSSPAPNKGESVKKKIEVFEKMNNGVEEVEGEKTARITRNAARNKAFGFSRENETSNQNQNVPFNKLLGSASKIRAAEQSTMTNAANKGVNSTRPAPIESSILLQKVAIEKFEKKRKEEVRIKRQAKEEDAKKKKEKTLKATSEETRRKREEKLLKVAAAREAAEREKALLAAKAEKEKEEKMRQMVAEKEKQKEEQIKKKLQMQQKALEHEERRKQEDAARVAKLKEQEEEHKRALAIKEREQELQKQQKAAELRLPETEKVRNHENKLGKQAMINNAKLKLQKTNPVQPVVQYEVTPSREDRPLLMSKTNNDYGIDDISSEDSSEDESHPKKVIPAWAQTENRQRLLLVSSWVPKQFWVSFMECNTKPDISQIFHGSHFKKRTRTSSAVWRTPPRCSHFLTK